MMTASDIRNVSCLSDEARQAVMAAFNAVSQWRDEIAAANDRCLTKVVDAVAAAQRAQGWPNSVATATRQQLLKAATVQTQLLEQLMREWEHGLKSTTGSPHPPMLGTSSADPVSEMVRLGAISLAPFKIWLNAAEAWQRSWADAMRGSRGMRNKRGRSKEPPKRAAKTALAVAASARRRWDHGHAKRGVPSDRVTTNAPPYRLRPAAERCVAAPAAL